VVGYFEGYGVFVDVLGFYGAVYDIEDVAIVGGGVFVEMKIKKSGGYGICHA